MNLLFPFAFSFKKRIKTDKLDSKDTSVLIDRLSHYLGRHGFKTVRKSGESTRFYDPDAFLSGIMHHSGRINNGMLTAKKSKDFVELQLTCFNYFTTAFVLLVALSVFIFNYQIRSMGEALILPAFIVAAFVAVNSTVRYFAHRKFVREMEVLAEQLIETIPLKK